MNDPLPNILFYWILVFPLPWVHNFSACSHDVNNIINYINSSCRMEGVRNAQCPCCDSSVIGDHPTYAVLMQGFLERTRRISIEIVFGLTCRKAID